jgi:integrase
MLEQLPRAVDGRIFHGAAGGKVDDDRIRQALIRHVLEPLEAQFPATEDLGFADGRLHSFRHYFCSMCANSGVPELMVMRWLGHSSSRMVKRYYHVHDREAQQQMQCVDFCAGLSSAGESPVPEERGAAAEQD